MSSAWLAHARGCDADLCGDLVVARVAVELLAECAPGAQDAAHLITDVRREADRAALIGEGARDGLADPPGGVGREPVAHAVVELLDRPDQAHVPLLDQVEQWHVRARVVACDRHHEAQVRLDQTPLGVLVAEVLAARELPLLGAAEQPPIAELADVELERVGRLQALGRSQLCVARRLVVVLLGFVRLVEGVGILLEVGLERRDQPDVRRDRTPGSTYPSGIPISPSVSARRPIGLREAHRSLPGAGDPQARAAGCRCRGRASRAPP